MRVSLETPVPALPAVALATAPVTGFATGFAMRRAPPTAPFDGPSMAARANAENLNFVKPAIAKTKVSESERK
jgi:hypothetical protein